MLKNILIGTWLTDESFALGMNKRVVTEDQLTFTWYNAAKLTAYSTWNSASLLGAVVVGLVANPYKFGLGFAITAMFIGLLYLQIVADKSLSHRLQVLLVGLTFILFYLGLIFIPSNFLVLFVTLIACELGVIIKHAFF